MVWTSKFCSTRWSIIWIFKNIWYFVNINKQENQHQKYKKQKCFEKSLFFGFKNRNFNNVLNLNLGHFFSQTPSLHTKNVPNYRLTTKTVQSFFAQQRNQFPGFEYYLFSRNRLKPKVALWSLSPDKSVRKNCQ